MRPEIEFLKKISSPSREFDAVGFVERYISYELDQLRAKSIHSLFHQYVVERGYPVPSDVIDRSSYVRRSRIEEDVKREILNNHNIILVGCEGSGKSTLVHCCISDIYKIDDRLFVYINASDMSVPVAVFYDSLLDKIRNSLFQIFDTDMRSRFNAWVAQNENDPFNRDVINTTTTKRFVESMLVFLRIDMEISIFIVLDNIDSLSNHAAKEFFSALNSLNEAVQSICSLLRCDKDSKIRYIICCRTQTAALINSASLGLFTHFAHKEIRMDERFSAETDILELVRRFYEKERDYIFGRESSNVMVNVKYNFGSITINFFEYADAVFEWVARSRSVFNKNINKFCGRSIRRAKLYGVKILGNAAIARLAILEKYQVIKITRDRSPYLERRLQEAIFDFSRSESIGLKGYPLNPFRVIQDDLNFRENPLIGVYSIIFMQENLDKIIIGEVCFAHAISAHSVINYLRSLRYSDSAIIYCFESFHFSGLIRPINGSNISIIDSSGNSNVMDSYILDVNALKSYYDLLICRDYKTSLIFYNCALRARYGIPVDRYLDNYIYEAFCFLLFLFDLIDREKQLEEKIDGTGISLKPLSARIRGPIFTHIDGEIRDALVEINRSTKEISTSATKKELVELTRSLFEELRYVISKQAGIM